MEKSILVFSAVGYIVGLALLLFSLIGIRGSNKWPGIGLFGAALLVWGGSYYLSQVLPGPLALVNDFVEHIVVPLLFLFAGGINCIYAVQAAQNRQDVTIFGWHGVHRLHTAGAAPVAAPAPAAPAVENQWDLAFLFFILAMLCLGFGLWLGWGSMVKAYDAIPDFSVSQRAPTSEAYEIGKSTDGKRGNRPLNVSARPFTATVYPDDFAPSSLQDPLKTMIDPEIKHLGVKVKRFIHVKYQENPDKTVDTVVYYETESLNTNPVPEKLEKAITRISVQTGGDVEAWVAVNVLHLLRLTSDLASGTTPVNGTPQLPVRRTVTFPTLPVINTIPAGGTK